MSPSTAEPLKVVLHVSDPSHLSHALANAKNLRAARPDAAIRLILNGLGVTVAQGKTRLSEQLAEAAAQGVQVQVCHNGLANYGIDESALFAGAEVVPAAIVALAEAQQSGYCYVKP